jgi:uncharacterized protein (TIGR02996 family)
MKDSKADERAAFLAAIKADRYDQAARIAFADWLEEQGEDDDAAVQRAWTSEKQRAEDWLTEFAEECEMSYAELICAANDYLDQGTEHVLGFMTPERVYREVYQEPGKFWTHFEVATGRGASAERRAGHFILCGC